MFLKCYLIDIEGNINHSYVNMNSIIDISKEENGIHVLYEKGESLVICKNIELISEENMVFELT